MFSVFWILKSLLFQEIPHKALSGGDVEGGRVAADDFPGCSVQHSEKGKFLARFCFNWFWPLCSLVHFEHFFYSCGMKRQLFCEGMEKTTNKVLFCVHIFLCICYLALITSCVSPDFFFVFSLRASPISRRHLPGMLLLGTVDRKLGRYDERCLCVLCMYVRVISI